MGLQSIEFGSTVKPVAIERFKGTTNGRNIISVISRKINASFTHYHENMAYFYCFKGRCCQDIGLAQVRYIVPIIEYTLNGNWQKKEYGSPLTIKYLSLGKESYDELMTMDTINGDLTKMDVLVTCTDEGYQKLKFQAMGPSKWRTTPAMVEETKKLFAEYMQLIGLSVARQITPEQYAELYAKEPRDNGRGRERTSSPRGSDRKALTDRHSAPQAIEGPGPDELLGGDLDTTPAANGAIDVSATSVPGADAASPGAQPDNTNFDDLLDGDPAKP